MGKYGSKGGNVISRMAPLLVIAGGGSFVLGALWPFRLGSNAPPSEWASYLVVMPLAFLINMIILLVFAFNTGRKD